MDRGPENESDWHEEFALKRFTLSSSPTAAAKFNQPAEDLLNHINKDISHWLIGNTLNDRYGRSVDGRFKSIKTAALAYSEIFSSVEQYLFADFGDLMRPDGVSFDSDYISKQRQLGHGGNPCTIDDAFLIATSIPVEHWTSNESHGVRTDDQYFLNRNMQTALRTNKPEKVLADCANPALRWVYLHNRWYKALSNGAAETSSMLIPELVARGWERRKMTALRHLVKREKQVLRVLKARRAAELAANKNAGFPSPPLHEFCEELNLDQIPDIDVDEISGYRED